MIDKLFQNEHVLNHLLVLTINYSNKGNKGNKRVCVYMAEPFVLVCGLSCLTQ